MTSIIQPPPPSGDAPGVRARHPQTLLRLARAQAPDAYPALEASLAAETRAVLEAVTPMTWLPIAVDVEVMEAVAARLDAATTAKLVQDRQREEMQSALFDGFVKTALRVLGASPSMLLKRLPAGWQHLFRNAGTVEIVPTGMHDAEARFVGLPAMCIGSKAWMAALPAGLRMLYELVDVKGTVTCRITDPAKGVAHVLFQWEG
jgi:hypothetical protein